jgi:hypothetical protein
MYVSDTLVTVCCVTVCCLTDCCRYLEFSLYKVGKTTNEALDTLCRTMGVKRNRYVQQHELHLQQTSSLLLHT